MHTHTKNKNTHTYTHSPNNTEVSKKRALSGTVRKTQGKEGKNVQKMVARWPYEGSRQAFLLSVSS